MQFVQTAFLGALAALAIPVIVHLIFRWQTRKVELGTIRFLADILRENARRRKLKRWLLLSMRMACVALLVLLFARPYLLATQMSGKQRLAVFLVDRSASMTLPGDDGTRFQAALERVEQRLEETEEDTDWELAFFDSSVEALPRGTDWREATEGMKPGNRPTSYGAAFAWARDVCVKSTHARRDVYLLTDLQRSGLDWTAVQAFPENVEVHVEDLGRDNVNNLSIIDATPSQTMVKPGETVLVNVTLFNFGPFPMDKVPVRLNLSAGRRSHRLKETVTLPSGQAAEVEFELAGLDAGLWQGTVEIDAADDLPFDNHRYLAVMAAPQSEVLIVDGAAESDEAVRGTYFLERALRLAAPGAISKDSPFVPHTVTYNGLNELPSLDGYKLVVLADVGDMKAVDADDLAKFVKAGGGLVVFTGEQVTSESTSTLDAAGLTPGRVTGTARTADLPFRLQSWDGAHPIFKPFADRQHGDLQRIVFSAHTQVEPAEETRVLAHFQGDAPAVTEHALGAGRVVWVLSSVDRQWTDWPRRLFLPVVHQILGDLVRLTDGGPVRTVVLGDTDVADRRGVHEHEGRWWVVNADPRESETDRCTAEELAGRFQFTLPGTETGLRTAGLSSQNLRADEIWHWVACLLLIVLGLEWFLANRSTA